MLSHGSKPMPYSFFFIILLLQHLVCIRQYSIMIPRLERGELQVLNLAIFQYKEKTLYYNTTVFSIRGCCRFKQKNKCGGRESKEDEHRFNSGFECNRVFIQVILPYNESIWSWRSLVKGIITDQPLVPDFWWPSIRKKYCHLFVLYGKFLYYAGIMCV